MGLQGHFCFPIQSIKKRGIVGNYFKALMIALWEVTIIGKLQRRYQAPEWFGALIVKHESRYEAPLEKFHIKARTFGSRLGWFFLESLASACNPRTCLPFPRHVHAEFLRRGTAHHKVTWKCRMHAEYFSWEGHSSTIVTQYLTRFSIHHLLFSSWKVSLTVALMDHSTQIQYFVVSFEHSAFASNDNCDSHRRSLARLLAAFFYFRARVSCALLKNDSYHIIGCAELVLIVQILRRGLSTSEASSLLRFPRCSHCSTFLLRFLAHTLSQKKIKVEITR